MPLVDEEFTITRIQKNWSPFIMDGDSVKGGSRGFVHIIQHIVPTTVLKCSLDDGKCSFVFKASAIEGSQSIESRDIRGGTAFIRLPQGIPEFSGRNIWIGVIKVHIKDCGGTSQFYRPHLALMEERNGEYSFLSISSAIHFNRDVLGWDLESTSMFFVNIMSPNSIVSWNVVSHDQETDTYEDYMELSFSEADFNSHILTLKGVIDYVRQVLRDSDSTNQVSALEPHSSLAISKCVCSHLREYCERYGKLHEQ